MRISDTESYVRLSSGLIAGAATVGRPTGVNGKNVFPRRAKVTAKEAEHIKSKAGDTFGKTFEKNLKAGGPGSGRHATGQTQDAHSLLKEHGYKVIPGSGGQGQVGYSKKIGSNTHFVYRDSEGWQHHALGKSGGLSIAHTSGKTTDELEKHLRKQK